MDNDLNIIYQRGKLVVLRVTVVGGGGVSQVGLVWVKKISLTENAYPAHIWHFFRTSFLYTEVKVILFSYLNSQKRLYNLTFPLFHQSYRYHF